MKTSIKTLLAAAALALSVAGTANATLTTIGTANYASNNYNLIWDNDSPSGSVVYLDFSNSFDTWANQVTWANGLNGSGVVSYNLLPAYSSFTWGSGWRLPSTVDGTFANGTDGSTTAGYNITTSELGHLFYTELGNKGYYDTSGNTQAGYGLLNNGGFLNLANNVWYWSGTDYAADSALAWYFDTGYGSQYVQYKDNGFMGLAVRSGQLEGAPVPEPSTLLLLGGGLAGLVGWRLRRRNG